MTEPDKEPTQAITPGADEEQVHDDPHQSDAEMTDPAQAAASEFEAD